MNLDVLKQTDIILDTELNYLRNAFSSGLLHKNNYSRQVQQALVRHNERVKLIFNLISYDK